MDAVPIAGIVHDLFEQHPEYLIRWHHAPNSNGSICQMPYEEHGTCKPGDGCQWEMRAAAYDFSQQVVRDWWLDNIIKPVMVHGDGCWVDGQGPDNGSWMCSGTYQWASLPAPYPPVNETEIDAYCAGEALAVEAAHDWLFANGGMDAQNCWTFVMDFPVPSDSPAQCAAKLQSISAIGLANNASTLIGFAMDRTGGKGYTDATAPQTIAAFLLTRGLPWLFGSLQTTNSFSEGVAALLLSDYGAPTTNMTNSTPFLFQRTYEKATVSLDCSNFSASFTLV